MSDSAEERPSWRASAGVALFFVAWTAVWLWPLPSLPGAGVVEAPYWWDAELNAYLLQEAGRNLVTDAPLYDARILHPTANVLALSENLFLWGLLSRFVPLGPVATHNLFLWLGIALSGFTAFLYLRRRASFWAAFAGAILFTYAPFRLGLLARLQLVTTAWIPVALLLLEAALARPGFVRFLALGAVALAQFTTGVYYALHLALVVVPTTLVSFVVDRKPWNSKAIAGVVGAGLLTVAVAWPLAGPYVRTAADLGLSRDDGFIRGTSGLLRDLATTSTLHALWSPVSYKVNEGSAREPVSFPGLVLVLLAVVAFVAWARRRLDFEGIQARFGLRTHLAWLVGALVLFVGTGENSLLGTWAPFGWLRVVPAFKGLRYPSRFAVLVTFVLAVFAAYAIDHLRRRGARAWVGPVVVLLALGETWTVSLPLKRTPPPEPILQQIQALPGTALLELPFDKSDHAGRIRRDLAVLQHGKRTLSGYTGFDPPAWRVTQDAMQRFPDDWSVAWLRRVDAIHVLAHLHELRPGERETLEKQMDSSGFVTVAEDAQHRVWRVPEGTTGVDPTTTTTDKVTWLDDVRVRPDPKLAPLFDDDPATRWTSNAGQAPDAPLFTVTFDAPKSINHLRLESGHFPLDFARGLRIEGLRDGTWTTLVDAPVVVPVHGLSNAPTRLALAFGWPAGAPLEALRFSSLGTSSKWLSVGSLTFGTSP